MDAATLRWTIIIIGVVILAAIFLFGNPEKKRKPRASRRKAPSAERREPTLDRVADPIQESGAGEPGGQGELAIGDRAAETAPPPRPRQANVPEPDKIITLFLLARDNHLIAGADLLQAALKTGMVFGEMHIFHRRVDGSDQAVFSLANALKPGHFDKDAWNTFETSGVALFLTLPGPMLALDGWEMMLATARRIAEILDAELHDGEQQPFTRQKEARIREEMRTYDRGRARQTFV